MEKRKLLEYLRHIMELEVDIQTANDTIDRINASRPVAIRRRETLPASKSYSKSEKEKVSGNMSCFGAVLGAISGIVIAIAFSDGFSAFIYSVIFALLGMFSMPWLLMAIGDKTMQNRERTWANEMKLVHAQIEEQADREYQRNVEIVRLENLKIDQTMLPIQNAKEDTRVALDRMYNLDIIYPKYRNLVAVSMFYEYLASGRCDSLEGRDGAYNMYEGEVRAQLIINELGNVKKAVWAVNASIGAMSTELRQIRENQGELYRSLESSRQTTERMADSVATLSKDVASARESAAVTAYQAEATARAATAMQKIAEFDHYRKLRS